MTETTSEIPLATRNDLFGSFERRYDTTILPACGKKVRFQNLSEGELSDNEMSGFERDMTGRLMRDGDGRLVPLEETITDSRGRLIIACLVDGEGKRMLSDADRDLVRSMDGKDTTHLYLVLRDHCGIGQDRPTKKN